MPGFTKGPNYLTPFGRNNWLRSTRKLLTESYTFSSASMPTQTIDGHADQKVLQPGTILARITSGAEAGKVGVFQRGTAGAYEIQSVTVDATGGTYTLTLNGEETGVIAFDATPGELRDALVALGGIDGGDIVVSGGPGDDGGNTPYSITFQGQFAGEDVPELVADDTLLTGGAGTAVVAEETAGSAGGGDGATDGRGNPDNIVGVCNTFLPYQLMERDVEVSVAYGAVGVRSWCFEYDESTPAAAVQLTQQTADEIMARDNLDLIFV